MATTVDIGVACAPNQTPAWWAKVMVRLLEANEHPDIKITGVRAVPTAVPDFNKNKIVLHNTPLDDPLTLNRATKTDVNRDVVVEGFLGGTSEWLWFLDDDTVPPRGALEMLLKAKRDFIAGIYYLGGFPHNPIVYNRLDTGIYAAAHNLPLGALFQVDSVGMGCTLIHRSVFERIVEGHYVLERPNGSLAAVPKSSVRGELKVAEPATVIEEPWVEDGIMHIPMRAIDEADKRPWPFYAMEYMRTEDHHFCELAANVGIRPWVDAGVICEHLKMLPVGRGHNKLALSKLKENGVI